MELSKMKIGQTFVSAEATKQYVSKTKDAGEIVDTLDETTTVWKNKKGYYWLDKFGGQMSDQFFKSEQEAQKDAKSAGVL